MARKPQPPLQAGQLQGFKYFALLGPLLERLRPVGTQRDQAGNRQLFFDQYVALLLLYFFNPILTSLRGLQQATGLDKVQKQLGVRRTSLGALSEAAAVFDPDGLRGLLAELVGRARPAVLPAEWQALKDLVAADGTLLRALPRMAWALWQDAGHRAAKLHLQFEVARGLPVAASVTPGNGAEVAQLRQQLQPGRLYVLDRGYAAYQLLRDILDASSSFLARLQEHAAYTVQERRPIPPAAAAAGVVEDVVVARLGTGHHKDVVGRPVRVLRVATGKVNADGSPDHLVLVTDRLDLPAELLALGYRWRWQIELFFRWLKCILGCRHLLGESLAGVTIQVYVALIASLLIALWTGRKPSKRTFEMLCFYFTGWATAEEVQRHIDSLPPQHPDTS